MMSIPEKENNVAPIKPETGSKRKSEFGKIDERNVQERKVQWRHVFLSS